MELFPMFAEDVLDSTTWQENPPIVAKFGHVHCDLWNMPFWANEEHPMGSFRGNQGHDFCGYRLEHFIPLGHENLDVNSLPTFRE